MDFDSMVNIEPANSITFRRPLQQSGKEILTIANVSKKPLAFKIKTTTPKQYCVRPNHGSIQAGGKAEIQGYKYFNFAVSLTSMTEEPPADFICTDKFLIMLLPIASVDVDQATINAAFENADKTSGVMKKKISVVFSPPSQSSSPQAQSRPREGSQLSMASEYKNSEQSPSASSTAKMETMLAVEAQKGKENIDDLKTKLNETEALCREFKKRYEDAKEKIEVLERMQKEQKKHERNSDGHQIEALEAFGDKFQFPAILVALIALFAFLVGLMF